MTSSSWAERLDVLSTAIKRVQATDVSKVPLRDFERTCKAVDDRFRDLIVEYEATHTLHRLSQGCDDAATWQRRKLEQFAATLPRNVTRAR